MPLKRASCTVHTKHTHSRKSSPNEVVSTAVSMTVKQQCAVDLEIKTASIMESSFLRTTVSPEMMSGIKIIFKDLVVAEFEGVKNEYINGFKVGSTTSLLWMCNN